LSEMGPVPSRLAGKVENQKWRFFLEDGFVKNSLVTPFVFLARLNPRIFLCYTATSWIETPDGESKAVRLVTQSLVDLRLSRNANDLGGLVSAWWREQPSNAHLLPTEPATPFCAYVVKRGV
jgi:hypothetical protein